MSINTTMSNPLANAETELQQVLETLQAAQSAQEAFALLHAWSLTGSALSVPVHLFEDQLLKAGFELMRRVLQRNIQARGLGKVGEALVIDEQDLSLDHKRLHKRNYESLFGTVVIERVGYGTRGQKSLHPYDEQFNLPEGKYSYALQKRACRNVCRGPYEESKAILSEVLAGDIPKRQLQNLVLRASQDFNEFYKQRLPKPEEIEQSGPILVSGLDCKGIRIKRDLEEFRPSGIPLGTGEKRSKKKMATVASIHSTTPYIRTARDVADSLLNPNSERSKEKRPEAENRRIFASIVESKEEIARQLAEEMKRRDPERKKLAVCLVDGEKKLHQIAEKHLGKAFKGMLLILDVMHVLGYLWEAAYTFYEARSEEARQWVYKCFLGILEGRVSRVTADIRLKATIYRLKGKARKAVDKACNYMLKNKALMQYDKYLALGLPIASGNVEGACGHLVKDRMERSGMIWGLNGAEAVLKLRAIEKSGDYEDYWNFYTKEEKKRIYCKGWRVAV